MRLERLLFPFLFLLLISPPVSPANTPRSRASLGKVRMKIGGEEIQMPKGLEFGHEGKQKENLLIILDASGSMWGQISLRGPGNRRTQKCKIEIAKKVLEEYIDDVDEEKVNVGLRVFGRYRERGCKDSQLLIPVGSLDKEAFNRTVRKVKPGHLGKTPIVHSLRKALVDISTPHDIRRFIDAGELSGGKKSIILITDGQGGCDSIEEVRGLEDDLRRLGVDIVEVSVIALKAPEEREQDYTAELGIQLDMEAHLRKISRSTEGQYISVEAKPSMSIEEFERQFNRSVRIVAPTNTGERFISLLYRSIGRMNRFISTHMSATIIPSMILFSIFFIFAMRWFFGK